MTETAPRQTQGGRAGARIGAIVIARHGRPDLDRTKHITWREYVDWWSQYGDTSLAKDQAPAPELIAAAEECDVVFASTMPRAFETALAVAAHKDIIRDPVFIEAPLPPPPMWGRMRPGHWGVWARVFWYFGRSAGGETRREAELRAEAAVATLTARALRGENVLLCAHGWFNRMMRPVLRRQGWRCVYDGGDAYWSHRRYVKAR
jgi:broad specificity phosphatase PhoE